MKIFNEHLPRHIVIDRMEPHWLSAGHTISNDPQGCDVKLSLVRIENNDKFPTLLRIDGIYYDLERNYKSRNSPISDSNSIADAVVYQSNYSQKLCSYFLKPRKRGAVSRVIYNGTNINWCGSRKEHDGINIVVISKWRRLKRLKEIIDLFFSFLKIVPNSTLHIVGKLHDNKPVKHTKIIYYGMVGREVVGNILTTADLSLHLCKRDSCPNSVVETIGAGVPVITTNKCGGTVELCSMTDGCIVCDGDFDNDFRPDFPYRDSYNILTPELYDNILRSMILIAKDRRSVTLPEQLTAKYMADQYINVMEEITR